MTTHERAILRACCLLVTVAREKYHEHWTWINSDGYGCDACQRQKLMLADAMKILTEAGIDLDRVE